MLRAYSVPDITKHFIFVKPPQQPYDIKSATTFILILTKLKFMERLICCDYVCEEWLSHYLTLRSLSCPVFRAKDLNCFLQEICKQNVTEVRQSYIYKGNVILM